MFGKVDVLRARGKFGSFAGETSKVAIDGVGDVPILSLKMMCEVKTAMWHDTTLDRDTRIQARSDVIWMGSLMKYQR